MYRSGIRAKSTDSVKRSFKLLDRWIKSGSSRQSPDEVMEPLNVLLSTWKKEYIKKPDATIPPRQLVETMDEWKRLLESSHSQSNIVEDPSFVPDTKSYTLIMEAAAATEAQPSDSSGSGSGEKNAQLIDKLLNRLLEDSKTDFAVQPTAAAFGAVCKAWANVGCKQAPSSAKIEEWISKMQELHDEGWPNLEPNIVIWNTLLNAWSKEGKVDKIEDTLQQLIRGEIPGVSPDTISFSTLLAAYARQGTAKATSSAEVLLEQMLELYHSGVESAKPTAISFSNVIQGFAQQGNSVAAQEWLQRLENLYAETQEEHLKPDVTAYNTCLLAFTNSGNPEGAERFLKASFPPFLQPNERSFNIVLSAWARAGDPYRAEATLQEMHDLYVNGELETKPSVVSYNTVLSAYAKLAAAATSQKGNRRNKSDDEEDDEPWKRAESILEHMDTLYQLGDEKVKANERTLNTVLDVCAKSGRPDVAERVFQKYFERTGGKTSVRTWNTLLSACMHSGDLPLAKRFWDTLLVQADPDIVSYNTYLNCYVRASMNRRKGKGGKFGISKQQEAQAVETIHRHLRNNPHVAPNRITHLAMINFWISRDDPERAEQYLLQVAYNVQWRSNDSRDQRKKNRRVAPVDRDLFHKVMAAWIPRKSPKNAESLLLKMADLEGKGMNLRPNVETYNVVLECHAKSGRIESGERAEVILREMETLSQAGDKDVKPNILSYNRVLNAWANSRNPTAVTRSDSLMLEMILKQEPRIMPDTVSYSTLLKTIASSNDADKSKRAKDMAKMMAIHDYTPPFDLRKKMENLSNPPSKHT